MPDFGGGIIPSQGEVPIDDSPFQITAAGTVAPLWMLFAFNLAAAASTWLLGFPRLAVVALAMCCATDAAFQRQIAHWLRSAFSATSEQSLTKLAAACAIRNSIMSIPATTMALFGGEAQIAYFGMVCAIGVLLAMATGTLSRKVFWGYAGPPLVATGIVVAHHFLFADALGIWIVFLTLALLLVLVPHQATEVVQSWQRAFSASRAMVVNLREARDLAVMEKVAADEAREEARQASKAKSNFLANMSHELRTPLNAILGFSQLLARDDFASRRAEYSKLIQESGNHLLNLVNDILDLSKMEVGRMVLSEQQVDLCRVVASCCTLMRDKAQQNQIALATELPRELNLRADERALHQILINLIGNALKFTPPGGSVTVFARVESDNTIAFGVSDTGIGIPEEDRERVFESFGQGRHDALTHERGTGLGLSIVKGLVEAHGGHVRLESKVGAGTSVVVSLPGTRLLVAKAA
jgi:signal transduction histidine kinase